MFLNVSMCQGCIFTMFVLNVKKVIFNGLILALNQLQCRYNESCNMLVSFNPCFLLSNDVKFCILNVMFLLFLCDIMYFPFNATDFWIFQTVTYHVTTWLLTIYIHSLFGFLFIGIFILVLNPNTILQAGFGRQQTKLLSLLCKN